jgi:type I restriction enzyme S subunit
LDGSLTSTGIAVLRPSEAINGEYLFRWVCSDLFVSAMSKAQDGTMYPAVTDKDVYGGSIPVPPLNEQRRIVAKLDSLFERTRRARDELSHIPRLIENNKKAILEAAFRGDLTQDWRSQRALYPVDAESADIDSRSGALPTLPSQWSWASIGAVSAISGGLTKNARRSELSTRAPYLRVANVYTDELRLAMPLS